MKMRVNGSARAMSFGIRLMASVASLTMAVPAVAQTDASQVPADAEDERAAEPAEIVVTGSRIDRAGFEAPTPTTVIGQAELRQGGRQNVGEVLADVPQFRATVGATTTAGNTATGTASADLRALGVARTLVLLNGHRFVGEADLNSIPFSAVKRIEVVTGGASAAWGSGAVAGVVNVLLNDEMDGVELNAETGISSRGDGSQHRFGITGGTDFADGRGSILLAGEYFKSSGISTKYARKNVGGWSLLANQGQGTLTLYPDVGYTVATPGGIILSGPLAFQQFNPDGTLRPFQFGSVISGVQTSGGDGFAFPDETLPLSVPLKRLNLFGRASYEITDSIRLSGDFRYSNVISGGGMFPDFNAADLLISVDNAFLPQAVRNTLLSAGQTRFVMGRANVDFGLVEIRSERETMQGTVGLEGNFGNWRWDAYYSHGEYRTDTGIGNLRIRSNYAEAVDSVRHPVTGQPICRSALTVPTTACVPVNLFGEGAPSEAALRYVLGSAESFGLVKLDVGAASLRGEPFSTWAGPVSVALGVEARKESSDTSVDPLSASGRFSLVNLSPLSGEFSVKEAFGEIVIPLVKDVPFFRNLELNGAARISDYSTSGSIWSWKVGVTNEIIEGLRIRAVRSRDIRAPSITELFTTTSIGLAPISDPVTNTTPFVRRVAGGNPDLQPETADTFTAGLVFEPSFIPGLSLSADYYSIEVGGAITVLSAQDIVSRCFAGNAALCSQIDRDAAGNITEVRANFVNLTTFKTSGVDMELSYRLPLDRISSLPGRLNLRVLANYTDKFVTDDGTTRIDTVGDLGFLVNGVPKWRGVASATYEGENVGIDLRARYIHGGVYNSQLNITNNDISSRTYVDLGVRFGVSIKGESRFTLFGSISNLFDRDPPIAPNPAHFDVIGRFFTIGARANF